MLETVGYVGYLWVVWKCGEGGRGSVGGGWGGVACLAGFALSVMTVSKTVLYGEFLFPIFPGYRIEWVGWGSGIGVGMARADLMRWDG